MRNLGHLLAVAGLFAACSSKASSHPDADDGHGDATVDAGAGELPAGWLYTTGNTINISDGAGGGTRWMGRGVNLDDIFLCGYNYMLLDANPDQTLEAMIGGLMTDWKPSFVRISLGMASYPATVSWLSDLASYKTPMTAVIDAIANTPGVHVLVTLRSDASMIDHDSGNPEPTGIPSDSTSTPDGNAFPTGTDAVYVALVDSFANSGAVLFGLSNEPGGSEATAATISAAMSHAVGVIRAEEDRLGVPHHVVSVQGSGYSSNISGYDTSPLPYDNVVYEVHGYPPPTAGYTYDHIPVILGEYGSLTTGDSAAFYADVEAKQIPNLAWDFESYSDCMPDLLMVNDSDSDLEPTPWGSIVKTYLNDNAI